MLPHYLAKRKCSTVQLNSTVKSVNSDAKTFMFMRDTIFICLSTQINSPHVFTRSSADADNRLDAFSSQSRSTNMVPFHMLHIVSYCAIVTLSLRRAGFTIFVFKKFHDLEMGVKGHSRSLRVVSFDRLCMVSY